MACGGEVAALATGTDEATMSNWIQMILKFQTAAPVHVTVRLVQKQGSVWYIVQLFSHRILYVAAGSCVHHLTPSHLKLTLPLPHHASRSTDERSR